MSLCWCLKGPILNFQKQKTESDDGVSRKLILLFQDCFSKCLIKSWQFNGHVGFKIFNYNHVTANHSPTYQLQCFCAFFLQCYFSVLITRGGND